MKHVSKNLLLFSEIIKAYSDCNDTDGDRNLNFLASAPLNGEQLLEAMTIAVPDGYNYFEPKKSVTEVVNFFGIDAEYFVAREGSVCIYIMPKQGNTWLTGHRAKKINADEFSFCSEKKMFRVWWD